MSVVTTQARDDRGIWKKALITVPAIVIVGGLMGVVSNSGFGNDWYVPLAKVLDAALDFARPGGRLVALIKPQFEAGRGEVGKGGVVRDPVIHQRVCDNVAAWIESKGWRVIGIETSPITGPEGNIEFLLGAVKED